MSAPRPPRSLAAPAFFRRHGLGLRVWGLALLAACAHSTADRATRTGPQEEAPPPATAPADDVPAADAPGDPGDDDRQGVFIEPTLAEACGIARARTYFDFDADDLSQGSRFALAELAECLKDGPLAGTAVTILGGADPRGTEAYNEALALSRARTVRDFLSEAGVDDGQMRVVSHGEDYAHQTDPLQWPFDRRVDIVRAGEAPPPVPNPDAPAP